MTQLIFLTSVSCYLFHFSHFNKRKTNMEIHKELPLEDSGTERKIKPKSSLVQLMQDDVHEYLCFLEEAKRKGLKLQV